MLTDVWLGSRPGDKGTWAATTGRTYDVRTDRYGRSTYSLAANWARIGAGTTGWICHRDSSHGMVAGLFAFDGGPEFIEDGIRYLPGIVFPLPRDWWIDGARIRLARKWMPSGPFREAPNRFQNGMNVPDVDAAVLRHHLHPVAQEWIERHT